MLDDEKLGGAQFKLEKLQVVGGELQVDPSFKAVEQTTSSEAETLGTAVFAKLEYGKYRLTETVAPDGYTLLNEQIDIDVSKDMVDITRKIGNKQKTILPETGAMGTLIISLYGVGFLLLGIAFIKRRDDDKKKVSKHMK